MSESPRVVVPAGWHVDPTAVDQLRWWTGAHWSDHTAPLPQALPSAEKAADELGVAGVTTESAPPQREISETGSASPMPEYDWDRESLHRDAAVNEPAEIPEPEEWRNLPSRWNTTSVWMIALVPIVTAAAVWAALILFNIGGWSWRIPAALALPYLWVVVFAKRDVKRLRRFGHRHTASAAWAVLTAPVYLIARSIVMRRYAGIRSAPIWIWLTSATIVAAASLVLWLSYAAMFMPQLVSSIEQSISTELSAGGTSYTVSCPIPERIGLPFECGVVDAAGTPGTVLVQIEDADGTFTYTMPELVVPAG